MRNLREAIFSHGTREVAENRESSSPSLVMLEHHGYLFALVVMHG